MLESPARAVISQHPWMEGQARNLNRFAVPIGNYSAQWIGSQVQAMPLNRK